MAQNNFQQHFAHLLPSINDQYQLSLYPTAPPQASFLADLLSTSPLPDITPDFHSTILELLFNISNGQWITASQCF